MTSGYKASAEKRRAWLGGLPEPQGFLLIEAIWLAAAAGKRLVLFFILPFPFARRRRTSDAFHADDRSHAVVV